MRDKPTPLPEAYPNKLGADSPNYTLTSGQYISPMFGLAKFRGALWSPMSYNGKLENLIK